MAESQIKVSSIMFTDIVGYSKMVSKDEKHALQLLDAHNQILTTTIDKFGGSVIKFIGDSVFAEFSKPEGAANCAIDIQKKLIDRNKIYSKNDRIHIRIGLHMGDLVVKGDDLFGNTVNLGSRIEGVAPSDGILISHPVYNAINRDASFFTKQLGFAKLKNIYIGKANLLGDRVKKGVGRVGLDKEWDKFMFFEVHPDYSMFLEQIESFTIRAFASLIKYSESGLPKTLCL